MADSEALKSAERVLVGCAGWAIPAQARALFREEGSVLKRYAGTFSAVEINSSFYRPHRRSTYARWADTVPGHFRFSVKAPKEITHKALLIDCERLLKPFVDDVSALESRLGCLLFQLPPRLTFDPLVARAFFRSLRLHYDGPVIAEPRHVTWFCAEAERLFLDYAISRAAADPERSDSGNRPGGNLQTIYYRLHGSPDIYISSYSDAYLAVLASELDQAVDAGSSVWCIFDNTARGEATFNALALQHQLSGRGQAL